MTHNGIMKFCENFEEKKKLIGDKKGNKYLRILRILRTWGDLFENLRPLELREFPEPSFKIYLRTVKGSTIECVCTTEGGSKTAYISFPGATCTAPATEAV